MSFPRYPKYKPSGVEWLGELPEHWNVAQSRRLFACRNERSRDGDQQLTASQEHGIITQEDFVRLEGRRVVEVLKGADILKHVEPNDFVISMRSFQGGLEHSRVRGCISSAYVMLSVRAPLHEPFFAHLFKSQSYIQALQATTNLVRDGQAMRYNNFTLVALPLVPLSEQRAIAAFLDRETAKIDALIAEQEKLIELLAEKRQAVISHAVTKGLNPAAPMKPSGIEWLGTVPAHWSVMPLRSAISFQEGPGIMASDFRESGIPLLRVSGVQSRWASLAGCNFLDPARVASQWARFQVGSGDLLISASASMGTVSEVGPECVGAVPYTGLIRLFPREGVTLRDFVRSVMLSGEFSTQVSMLRSGSTIQHFGPTHLNQMRIVVPPRIEQEEIARHVDQFGSQIESLVAEARSAMDLLRERRSALISAAVTGQIDVRNAVPEPAA